MPSQALVVSRRGPLLEGVLRGLVLRTLEVTTHESLPAALSGAGRIHPHLVLIDTVTLPGDELGLLPHLRRRFEDATVAVIVAEESDRLRDVLRAGVDVTLLDPFDLEVVVDALRGAFDPGVREGDESRSLDALAVFLKGMSHEVLNPLTSVSGIVQLLLHDDNEDEEHRQRYRTVLSEVERIQKILRELDHFVRARKPPRRRIAPGTVLEQLQTQLAAQDPPLQATVEVHEQCPAILGDPDGLTRALQSLARFAAGPAGVSPVQLAVSPVPRGVDVEVVGTCPVALPDPPEKLFIPYHEASAGMPSGLELSAAHGILRNHQGFLEARREADGSVGFRIFIPQAPAEGS